MALTEKTNVLVMRKMGHYLSDLIMPNLSVFITWGFLTIATQFVTGNLQQALIEVTDVMLRFLLPILIGYRGGSELAGTRGGVIAAIATTGVIITAAGPQLMGAMAMGPITGFVVKQFDRLILPKVKSGYEMLVKNFSAGILGGLLCCFGFFLLGPAIQWFVWQIDQIIGWLVLRKLLPIANIFLEPLKVLFFNNTINHGLLTPLGIAGARQEGTSILFLLETNPGPGIGVLLSYLLWGKQQTKASASGALMIHAIGGIHEIYFPFVLMNPGLFGAVIIGGVAGTTVFQLTGAGLIAPVSPGSLLTILTNANSENVLAVFSGILVSALVSFLCSAVIIRRRTALEANKGVSIVEPIKKIYFACDAGMGSSAMGASLLRRELSELGIELPVEYTSVYHLEDEPDLLVITQKEYAQVAAQKAPNAQKIVMEQFIDQKAYQTLATKIAKLPTLPAQKQVTPIVKKCPYQGIVFLYADDVRGSQTMAVSVLSQVLKAKGQAIPVKKVPIEEVLFQPEKLYIVTAPFLQEHPVAGVPLLVVDHLVTFDYEKLVKGGFADVSFHPGTTAT